MLYTRRGSEDGFIVRQFHEGISYDMADGLACYFIRARWAVELRDGQEVLMPCLPPLAAPFSFQFS